MYAKLLVNWRITLEIKNYPVLDDPEIGVCLSAGDRKQTCCIRNTMYSVIVTPLTG